MPQEKGPSGAQRRLKLNYLLASAVMLPLVPNVAFAQDQTVSEDTSGVDEIVVTARKREENVQDVPISISAFSAESLDRLGAQDLTDVARFAPNVSFDGTAAVSGSSIASTVYIRGVGQTDFTLNSDPGVGLYIDGVYVARSVGGLLDLVDIETVEVLRGPQGTLFGKNTIGGAINVTTRRPDQGGGGYFQLEGGNFARANFRGGFDIPISDTLVAGVAGAVLTQDGYQDRILQPEEEDLGNINRYVARGRLLWTPTSNFEADLILDYTRGREQSMPQTVVEFELGTGAPFLPAAGGAIPGTVATLRPEFAGSGYTGADFLSGFFNDVSPDESYYGGESRSDFDIFGSSLNLSLDLSETHTLRSISAYREVLSDFARDSLSSPFLAADTIDSYDQFQFSQEFQLLGDFEGFNYVVGAYYLTETGTNSNLVATSIGDLFSGGSVDNESLAAFAQANLEVTDRLGFTFGIRYTDETKRFDPGYGGGEQVFVSNSNGLALGLPATVPLIVAPETLGLGNFYTNSDDKFDFTLSLNFDLTEDVLLYASYSTGFKAGGFSQRIGPGPGIPAPDFEREDVQSYEAGFKTMSFDNTLRLNGAIFFADYENIQATPIFEGIGPVTRNLGNAEIWGVELEWNYAPNDVFEFSGGVGYLHDELTSLTPVALTNVEIDGVTPIITLDTQLPKTPTWSVNAAVGYHIPVGTSGEFVLRGNWSFTSDMYNDVLNSEVLRRDDLHLLGASIEYAPNEGDWLFRLSGNNLTDEEYIIAGNDETAFGQFGYAQATYARPREWWVTIRREF